MKRIFIILVTMLLMTACQDVTNEDHITTPPEGVSTSMTTEESTTIVTEPILFDSDITFMWEYISDGMVMPYLLYTPSTASESEAIPLIVWLHGSGERNASKEIFLKRGLPNVLNNWTLEGFNAYVLCPQLIGEWNSGMWSLPDSRANLQSLLDKFINEHNVDINNIIVTGHSLGGQGAIYMAHQLPEYFSKLAVLSGYWPNINISEITIPTVGYVGTAYAGEDVASIDYMTNVFASIFDVFSLESSHGNLPNAVFNEDKDGNNRSDIIEWMLIN